MVQYDMFQTQRPALIWHTYDRPLIFSHLVHCSYHSAKVKVGELSNEISPFLLLVQRNGQTVNIELDQNQPKIYHLYWEVYFSYSIQLISSENKKVIQSTLLMTVKGHIEVLN